jgi:dienelactone hydrolase
LFFSDSGDQMGFIISSSTLGYPRVSILYYRNGMAESKPCMDMDTLEASTGMSFKPLSIRFGVTEGTILFQLQKERMKYAFGKDGGPVIWSYTDTNIATGAFLKYNGNGKSYDVFADAETGKINFMGTDQFKVYRDMPNGILILVDGQSGNVGDQVYHPPGKNSYYFLTPGDHVDKPLFKSQDPVEFYYTVDGNYIVFYDQGRDCYMSYDMKRKALIEVLSRISESFYYHSLDESNFIGGFTPVGILGTIGKSSYILVYSNFDIWKLDLTGVQQPVNLTGGYGVTHHIKFKSLAGPHLYHSDLSILSDKGKLYLTGFDTVTKYNGVFSLDIEHPGAPEKLIFGPYNIYQAPFQMSRAGSATYNPFIPVKARDAEIWVIRKMSFNESPNYFATKDFRAFTCLTNLYPEKTHSWLTAELIRWPQLDGTWGQGMMYKPEDFSPTRQYPVIFTYYMRLSDQLYDFPKPEFMSQGLNIPYFVDKGYVVVVPDIVYKIGKPGKSACNAVVSAAQWIATMPWAKDHKFGMIGHSFGGFETFYLTAHSEIFSAAVAAAGLTNLVEAFNVPSGENFNDGSDQSYFEHGQFDMGSGLWESKTQYLDNSPVFSADKVKTPVLVVHNPHDGNVQWGQGIQFYMGLRYLHKPVWMLQYPDEGHVIRNEASQIDYTERVLGFFNYYLKGMPCPGWMKGYENSGFSVSRN